MLRTLIFANFLSSRLACVESTSRAVRAARQARLRSQSPRVVAPEGPEAELAAIEAAADAMVDAAGADEIPLANDVDAWPESGAAEEEAMRRPRHVRCHFAYIGLSLRWVARVANYTGWDDLVSSCDLSSDIAHAKALAARAAHLLYITPATPESSSNEAVDFEALSEWERPHDHDLKASAPGVSASSTSKGQPTRYRLTPEIEEAARSKEVGGWLSEVVTVERKLEASGSASACVRLSAPALPTVMGRTVSVPSLDAYS